MRKAAELPFAPNRLPFYYGWVIAVVATIGTLMSVPGQTVGVSVFTDALVGALPGGSRVGVAGAYLVGTVLSALTLPLAGRLLDRFGARPTALAATVLLSLTLAYLSTVDRIAWALGGSPWLGLVLLAIGFYALRLSGQGTLTMVSRTLLGRWFDRRRGLVAGASGVFVGFGFGYAPRLFEQWIQAGGWRGAWQQMALLELVVMGAMALVFLRDDPETCGLSLDGRTDHPTGAEEAPSATRAEAIRTLAFWAVTAGLSAQALVITAISFHIVDLGASAGLDREAAVAFFLPLSVVSTGVGVLAGALGDRLSPRVMVGLMMGAQAMGLVGAADLESGFWWAAIGLGISGGFFAPLATIAFPRFFGRKHLGAITGVEMMAMVIGSAIGPALFAGVEQATGSYRAAALGCLTLPAAVLLVNAVYREPRRYRGGTPVTGSE